MNDSIYGRFINSEVQGRVGVKKESPKAVTPKTEKDMQREEIAQLTENWLRRGNKIDEIPAGVSGDTRYKLPEKSAKKYQAHHHITDSLF